jgi:hypothetical protein
MNNKKLTILSILIVIAAIVLAACASSSTTPGIEATSTVISANSPAATQATSQPTDSQLGVNLPSGAPPSGSPPNGAPPSGSPPSGDMGAGVVPGGGSASSADGLATATGAFTLDRHSATQTGQTFSASGQDESAIYVTNGGQLTISNATINTSGNTSSTDSSSFYGLNAGVLAASGSSIDMSDSTVTTTGTGANGVFATGSGSSVSLSNVTINASGNGAHGAMASAGGTLDLADVDITTTGTSAAPIATDRGGGTITVSGGTTNTSGTNSPCLYSTGSLSISGLTCIATGSESAVIEGANSITLTNSRLTSSMENKWGVMIYQSMSGDAEGTEGTFTMTGGTLANTANTGPLFFVTNSTAYITLKAVEISAGSGVLVEAGGTSQWGTSGANGGTVYLTADEQNLTGNFITDDEISSIAITLQNGSSLSGAINSANSAKEINLTLDGTSTWNVTADSYLTCLTDTSGISGNSISNIIGNGHTVYYKASACSALGGLTYSLSGGGSLIPAP